MPKVKGQLYPKRWYESEPNGAPRKHRIPKERWRLLGQGKALSALFRLYQRDNNADVEIQVFTGCIGDEAPGDTGRLVLLTQGASTGLQVVVINTLGITEVLTEDLLLADVEVVLTVRASSGTQQVRVEAEGWTTVHDV